MLNYKAIGENAERVCQQVISEDEICGMRENLHTHAGHKFYWPKTIGNLFILFWAKALFTLVEKPLITRLALAIVYFIIVLPLEPARYWLSIVVIVLLMVSSYGEGRMEERKKDKKDYDFTFACPYEGCHFWCGTNESEAYDIITRSHINSHEYDL